MRSLLLILLSLLLPASAAGAGLRIVVDPGHGGDKRGAVSPAGLLEKDVALAIALRLRDELVSRGHEVVLTREKDESLDLGPRIRLANEKRADLFLSVHANSMATRRGRARTRGIETYFLSAEASDEAAAAVAAAENADRGEGDEGHSDALGAILADLARTSAHEHSSRLAQAVHQELIAATGAKDRGVRQAPFFVLEGAQMPAVLLEVGYISHPVESKRLAEPDFQATLARAVAEGVERFRRQVLEVAAGE